MKKLLFLFSLLSILTMDAYAAAGAAIDVADVTTTLSNQISSITAVGGAIIVLAAIVTAIAFVRRAASGR